MYFSAKPFTGSAQLYWANARIFSSVPPRISTRLLRLCSPAAILTAASGTFKRDASSLRRASFARSSTGGAVKRTLSAPWYSPAIWSRLARGWTRTAKLPTPSFSVIRNARPFPFRRKAPSPRGFRSRPLRWPLQNRATFPWTGPATNPFLSPRELNPAFHAAVENRAAPFPRHQNRAAPPSNRATPGGAVAERLRQGAPNPRSSLPILFLPDRALLRSACSGERIRPGQFPAL